MEEIEIDTFSKKGRGQGMIGCRAVVVPGSLPGDVVQIDKKFRKKKKWMADLVSIVKPAENRMAPRCTHFPICGGCSFQTLPYKEQLKWKQQKIEDLFSVAVEPILGMENPWFYRNKMEYTFGRDQLGLIAAGRKGMVVDLESCVLTPKWFMETLQVVRRWWKMSKLSAYRSFSNTGTLRTLTLREGVRTGDRMLILSVSGHAEFAPARHHLEQLVEMVGDLSVFVETVHVQKGEQTQRCEMHLSGAEILRERLCNLEFAISPSSFFQPNTVQAERLFLQAKQRIGKVGLAYDLYCGMGTIGMIMADKAERVIGIELNPYAVCDAETNLERNAIRNMEVFRGDVQKILKSDMESAEMIFLDPPRAGLTPKGRGLLKEAKAQKILYISCNPQSQSVDVQELCENGYIIEWILPVDQFPHTPHIENICLLKRA